MDYEFTEADAKQDARIIEQLQARVKELEADRLAISKVLDNEAIEHSGYIKQAGRVSMLAERNSNRGRMLVQKQLRIRELERLLALPCKHDWESFCKHPVAFDPPEQWFRCRVCKEETDQPE